MENSTQKIPEPRPIYLIALVVGNNDYNTTFVSLLESINRVLMWRKLPSEAFVEDLIRSGIRFHYLGFQVSEEQLGNLAQTVEYLQKNVKVLFNEEAEKDIQTQDHDHGAWYLEVTTGEIYDY
jgi:hypothetical protein